MAQYSTKMIFAVLNVSLIMGLNIVETDKVFTLIYTQIAYMRISFRFCRNS